MVMPSEDTKILEFNQYQKSDKVSPIIYTYFKHLIKKVDRWKNNPAELSTTKIGEHIPCGYSMSTIYTYDGIENNHDVYRGEDCMKKFREYLGKHEIKIIKFEKKKMIPLIGKKYESYLNQKNFHICKKRRFYGKSNWYNLL